MKYYLYYEYNCITLELSKKKKNIYILYYSKNMMLMLR